MIEEVKEDNNCIVKAFENNPIAILHENIDNKKVYYFKASDIGKALNLTNIAVSIQNYDDDEKVIRKAYDLRGCEQDTTFLTSQGVYRLLYNSKKDIAKKFRKWAGAILDDIIFNESQELKRQLEKQNKLLEQKEQLLLEHKEQTELEKEELLEKNKLDRHNLLIAKMKNKNCIYLAEIDNMHIKIGSSENVDERIKALRRTFSEKNMIFIDIFECDQNSDNFKKIELAILTHPMIKQNLQRNPINNYVSREVVKLNEFLSYESLYFIVSDMVNKFNNNIKNELIENKKLDIENKKLDIEEQKIKLLQTMINNNISIEDINKLLYNKNDKIIEEDCLNNNNESENVQENKYNSNFTNEYKSIIRSNNNNPRGKRVLQLNPGDLSVYKTYSSTTDVIKQNKSFVLSRIKEVIKENKIYKNFRWVYEGNDIKPTVQTKNTNSRETILQLNMDKTQIINSFPTRKEIYEMFNLSKQSLNLIIEKQYLYQNHYFIYYKNCPKILLDNYNDKIKFYKYHNSIKIKQIDANTGTVVIFNSYSELYKKYSITSNTIKNAIKNKIIYNGFIYEYVTRDLNVQI